MHLLTPLALFVMYTNISFHHAAPGNLKTSFHICFFTTLAVIKKIKDFNNPIKISQIFRLMYYGHLMLIKIIYGYGNKKSG